ncbi:hypothetical protein ACI09E_003776 [Cronobacter dublinensis]
MGVRPDAASRDDNCDEFTPIQNLNYTHRRAELAAHRTVNPLPKIPSFSRKKPCMHKMLGFACVFLFRHSL